MKLFSKNPIYSIIFKTPLVALLKKNIEIVDNLRFTINKYYIIT